MHLQSAGDVLSLESRALLAFALNRRNKDGDRPRAMSICEYILQQLKPSKDGQQDTRPRKLLHDVHGLMGRIHKDAFIESLHESHRTGMRANYKPCDEGLIVLSCGAQVVGGKTPTQTLASK